MIFNRAHKIRLYPNAIQEQYLKKACGTSRFIYNWGLERWQQKYKNEEKVNSSILAKELRAIRDKEYPWISEVTCDAFHSLTDLQGAFRNFFRRLKRKEKPGFPKFKRKGVNDSFYINNQQLRLKDKKVYIPKLGWVKLAEEFGFPEVKILSATVSRIANKWFISINAEIEHSPPVRENQGAVGIDLGINIFAVLSNGEKFESPRPLKRLERRLKRLQKSLSRKQKGSNNRDKAKMRLANLYYRISCIRNDFLHKLTTNFCQDYNTLYIEDLNTSGMMKNSHLSKAISDQGWFEFRRQLEYKSQWYGSQVKKIDRFFASSKTCSNCGYKKEDLKLSDRVYVCKKCGKRIDRDLNAAINIKNEGLRILSSNTEGSPEFKACGENIRPSSVAEKDSLVEAGSCS